MTSNKRNLPSFQSFVGNEMEGAPVYPAHIRWEHPPNTALAPEPWDVVPTKPPAPDRCGQRTRQAGSEVLGKRTLLSQRARSEHRLPTCLCLPMALCRTSPPPSPNCVTIYLDLWTCRHGKRSWEPLASLYQSQHSCKFPHSDEFSCSSLSSTTSA